ncbi:MAG: preprotein translocase subunit SecA [Patescibacteria group bacterium]
MSFFSAIFGDESSRAVARFQSRLEEINALEEAYRNLSDEQIRAKIAELRAEEEKTSEFLDRVLPDVFAMVREASRRTSGKRHFDVQMLGGMALHGGAITEMRTGEGKTLVATLPVALNALMGRGAHVVTVNDYLARRDATWMGEIYNFLGFSIGCINHDASYIYDPQYKEGSPEDQERDALGSFRVVYDFLKPCNRRDAYVADITYGTNNEFGFDWLRDNLVYSSEQLVQRGHYFAIVDEVDSILIDEARTPLIISAADEEAEDLYKIFSKVAPRLKRDVDYTVDEKHRAVLVTDAGISQIEGALNIKDLYTERGVKYVRHLEQALRAEALFQRDRHYVVRDGQIIIVDEFTGRMMPGRRWSEGLHQAVEAKEGVPIQRESRTLATITFQNYFRMYEKLSGMTGTAKTSEEEFQKVYNLDVITIPTNQAMVRVDQPDRVYQTEHGKFQAIVREVKERHETGQPILLGTASIEKNEKLSTYLRQGGIQHNVLNAKNHEHEAEIIAQAGRKGAVTVATNIAGRGVDILLGGNPPDAGAAEAVRAAGGLLVLGTERHEARRIDNQLRGRAGRQGDPGESQFHLSLEDDLLRIFAPDRIKNLMGKLGIPEDEPIETRLVSRAIEQAQEKIEGLHFDSRKHVLEYDDVMSRQRNSVYKTRRETLAGDDLLLEEKLRELIGIFSSHMQTREIPDEELRRIIGALIGKEDSALLVPEDIDWPAGLQSILEAEYQIRREKQEGFLRSARSLVLQIIDMLWKDHLEVMEYTRSSVGLRAYGQRDPLVEYKNEAHRLFKTFNENLATIVVENLFKIGTEQSTLHHQPHTHVPMPQEVVADKGIGRNDPCPCGSGKKYKKCHGK